jgi:hypothetical protein
MSHFKKSSISQLVNYIYILGVMPRIKILIVVNIAVTIFHTLVRSLVDNILTILTEYKSFMWNSYQNHYGVIKRFMEFMYELTQMLVMVEYYCS